MTLPRQLTARLQNALTAAGIEVPEGIVPTVVASQDLRFGDYQSNIAMTVAKAARANPREMAGRIVAAFDGSGLCAAPEIAGPGFINFRILPEAWAGRVVEVLRDDRCAVPQADPRHTIVVDFSAPNVAKPMHVGHIRSTIIGDSLSRIARYLGHEVITDNHIGDWGTQFGMIIHGWKTLLDETALANDPIHELLRVYKEVNALTKADPAVLETCKAELVRLQGGDEENLAIWKRCVEVSKTGLQRIYDRLGIRFDHWLGESFYNDQLGPIVAGLLDSGLAEESEGAVCVFFRGHPQLEEKPCLIRKADGGFLYATTDLATIDHRLNEWKADEVWYVVGAPQQLHFQQIFEVVRRTGREAKLVHVAHGSILGPDRKMMKTRSGENVQLVDVLDEAVVRARAVVEEKNPDLPEDEKQSIAGIVGLGSVKFAELFQHRMTDYIFSWEKMLSLQGDTAPYLQNAGVRIRSIFRKHEGPTPDFASLDASVLVLAADEEVALARQLSRFGEVLPAVLEDFRPNLLAAYLLDLAGAFHAFFAACPVLKAEEPARTTRLALCAAADKVLTSGLGLLGIGVPERM